MKNPASPDLSLLARQWGATAVPFSQMSWLATPHSQRAMALLDQAAALRSAVLLDGPNGVGKSALVGRWVHQLERRLVRPLVLTHASLSGSGVLHTITAHLGKPPSGIRATNLARIEAALGELGSIVPVIVLDEAQPYSASSLDEVRLLLGVNLAEPSAFALVLIGDEYLLHSLRLRHQRALCSRLSGHCRLPAWNGDEVRDYRRASLAAVGIEREAIEPAAIALLTRASGGLARSLCLLARAAWITAARAGVTTVTAAHVQEAIETVPGAAGLSLPPPAAEAQP
jgi:type II secretory pathway predicted ATPase ExeA